MRLYGADANRVHLCFGANPDLNIQQKSLCAQTAIVMIQTLVLLFSSEITVLPLPPTRMPRVGPRIITTAEVTATAALEVRLLRGMF